MAFKHRDIKRDKRGLEPSLVIIEIVRLEHETLHLNCEFSLSKVRAAGRAILHLPWRLRDAGRGNRCTFLL